MTYCGSETRTSEHIQYCTECSCEIPIGSPFIAHLYDYAMDADDGYGDFDFIVVCTECSK
jgi:hypothetical protein